MTDDTEKPIQKSRGFQFTKIYATNVVANETDSDVRLYFFNELLTIDGEKVAVADGVAMLSKQAAMLLNEQLNKLVEGWKERGQPVEISADRRKVFEQLMKE